MKAHLEIMAQKNVNCNFVPTLKKPTCAHRFYCFEVQYTSTTSHKMRSNHVPMLALATSQYKITKNQNIAV